MTVEKNTAYEEGGTVDVNYTGRTFRIRKLGLFD